MCTSYSDCNAHGKYDVPLTADWTVFEVPFADAIQDPGNPSTTRIPTFDKSKITAIQIQINANYVDGGAVPNDFECWFDDLHFY
jgi:hypothetical protein